MPVSSSENTQQIAEFLRKGCTADVKMILRDTEGEDMGSIPLCRSVDASVISRVWSNHNAPGKDVIDAVLIKVQKKAQKKRDLEQAAAELSEKETALKKLKAAKTLLEEDITPENSQTKYGGDAINREKKLKEMAEAEKAEAEKKPAGWFK